MQQCTKTYVLAIPPTTVHDPQPQSHRARAVAWLVV